jgi:hypothetical protein
MVERPAYEIELSHKQDGESKVSTFAEHRDSSLLIDFKIVFWPDFFTCIPQIACRNFLHSNMAPPVRLSGSSTYMIP